MAPLPKDPIKLLQRLHRTCATLINDCGGGFLVLTFDGERVVHVHGTQAMVQAVTDRDMFGRVEGSRIIKGCFSDYLSSQGYQVPTLVIQPVFHTPSLLKSNHKGIWRDRSPTVTKITRRLREVGYRHPFAVYCISASGEPVEDYQPLELGAERWWEDNIRQHIGGPWQPAPRVLPSANQGNASNPAGPGQAARSRPGTGQQRRQHQQLQQQPQQSSPSQPISQQRGQQVLPFPQASPPPPPQQQQQQQPSPQSAGQPSPSASFPTGICQSPACSGRGLGYPPCSPPQPACTLVARAASVGGINAARYIQMVQHDVSLWAPVALSKNAWAMCDMRVGVNGSERLWPFPVKERGAAPMFFVAEGVVVPIYSWRNEACFWVNDEFVSVDGDSAQCGNPQHRGMCEELVAVQRYRGGQLVPGALTAHMRRAAAAQRGSDGEVRGGLETQHEQAPLGPKRSSQGAGHGKYYFPQFTTEMREAMAARDRLNFFTASGEPLQAGWLQSQQLLDLKKANDY